VNSTFGVTWQALPRARATAAAIFAAGGIEIHWRLCGTGRRRADRAGDPCPDPLGAAEVSARLIRSDRDEGEEGSLGFSLVDTAREFGSLATVFPDRVRAIALRAGVPFSAVLGRALAHEIGHLLLGTTAHGAGGVMRPRWNLAVLRGHTPDDWVFSADERFRIAQSLRKRSAGGAVSSLAAVIVP
jgi:hypothetical protein